MKVIYRKPIRQQIADAIHQARSEGKTIERIELSPLEWREFELPYDFHITPGRPFMGVPICLEKLE